MIQFKHHFGTTHSERKSLSKAFFLGIIKTVKFMWCHEQNVQCQVEKEECEDVGLLQGYVGGVSHLAGPP